MPVADGKAYRFEGFTLDLTRGCLLRDDHEIELRPKSFEVLRHLVENAGRLVPKDEFANLVWPNVVVTDESLTRCISDIRLALGDSERRLIRTAPRRGYRFAASVSQSLAKTESPNDEPYPRSVMDEHTATQSALPDKPSIAVLSFVNLSNDPEQEFLADGIAEDVITALSRYPSLFVIARNSCFTYKGRVVEVRQVGRELGVRYVLEGSLRKAGNRIRVTAQLVEAETSNHVWAERYDRDLADIFAVQDEISQAVTMAIAPAIAGAERQRAMRKPPENLDAWAAYQRGLWHLSPSNAEEQAKAIESFQQAIDLDRKFTGGYCGLAMAQIRSAVLFATHDLAEMSRSAEALVRRAVALDDADAEARECLANVLWMKGDHAGALAEAEQALAISPDLARAHYQLGAALVFSGRRAEGTAALEKSIRLDPRPPGLATTLLVMAVSAYLSRDYEAAVTLAQRTIRLYPDYPISYRWLAAALGQLDRHEEAQRALDKALAVSPASFNMFAGNRPPYIRAEDYAHVLEGLRKAGWEG